MCELTEKYIFKGQIRENFVTIKWTKIKRGNGLEGCKKYAVLWVLALINMLRIYDIYIDI